MGLLERSAAERTSPYVVEILVLNAINTLSEVSQLLSVVVPPHVPISNDTQCFQPAHRGSPESPSARHLPAVHPDASTDSSNTIVRIMTRKKDTALLGGRHTIGVYSISRSSSNSDIYEHMCAPCCRGVGTEGG